jgi:hypothetical protein
MEPNLQDSWPFYLNPPTSLIHIEVHVSLR